MARDGTLGKAWRLVTLPSSALSEVAGRIEHVNVEGLGNKDSTATTIRVGTGAKTVYSQKLLMELKADPPSNPH